MERQKGTNMKWPRIKKYSQGWLLTSRKQIPEEFKDYPSLMNKSLSTFSVPWLLTHITEIAVVCLKSSLMCLHVSASRPSWATCFFISLLSCKYCFYAICNLIISFHWITNHAQLNLQFSLVTQSCPILCNPMECRCQASLSIINSQSLLKLMSIELVMPSKHLTLSFPSPSAFNLSQHQGHY